MSPRAPAILGWSESAHLFFLFSFFALFHTVHPTFPSGHNFLWDDIIMYYDMKRYHTLVALVKGRGCGVIVIYSVSAVRGVRGHTVQHSMSAVRVCLRGGFFVVVARLVCLLLPVDVPCWPCPCVVSF